jgi:hypothetical protein
VNSERKGILEKHYQTQAYIGQMLGKIKKIQADLKYVKFRLFHFNPQ